MAHSVASGTAALLLARLAPPAASFGVFYLALLHWEPETWGLFHLLLSAQAVLQMAAGLGIDLLVLQKSSTQPKELPRLLRAAAALLLRVGFGLGLAMVLFVAFVTDEPQSIWAAVFFGGAIPAASLAPTLETSWVSLGRAHRLAPIVILEHGTRVLGSFAALSMGGGPALLALVLLLSKWLGTALLFQPLRSGSGATERLSLGTVVRQASPYALFFAAAAFLSRMDSLVLAFFRPMDEVGYYGAATRLVLFCTIASQAFGLALYPHLAASRSSSERYHRVARASLVGLGAVSFVPTGLLHAFSETTLRVLHVDTYLPAASLLSILSLALPALFSSEAFFRCLLAEERLRSALRVAGLQMVMGIPALFAGAFLHGARGVAMVSVFVAWAGALGYLISLQRNGLVLWSSWAPVMAIGGAVTLGMSKTAATRPIGALAILSVYALMIVGQAGLRRRGSPSTLDLLTSSHRRSEVPEEKSDNPQ